MSTVLDWTMPSQEKAEKEGENDRLSRSRSNSQSRSQSQVRSRSHSRGRSHSRSYSRSRSRSATPSEGVRIHVADLGMGVSKRDLEKVFDKYGPLKEIWLARSPPCFAFIVFRHKDDAEDALRATDGTTVCGHRIRVTYARPRTRGRGRRGFDPNMRCYQCGEKGHFSRDCPDTKYGYKRPPSRFGKRRGIPRGLPDGSSWSNNRQLSRSPVRPRGRYGGGRRRYSRSRSHSRDRGFYRRH